MKVPEIDNPLCQIYKELEGVQHVLLRCPRWQEQREECMETGLKGETRPSLKALLSTKKGCLAAVRMIQRTGLLAQFQSCDIDEVEEEEVRGGEDEEEGTLVRG
jgi:hypothetical protein